MTKSRSHFLTLHEEMNRERLRDVVIWGLGGAPEVPSAEDISSEELAVFTRVWQTSLKSGKLLRRKLSPFLSLISDPRSDGLT